MATVRTNGISIEYEDAGDPGAPVVLLINGLGAQLTLWPEAMISGLVGRGFRIVRFDNRDIGLSSKFDAAGIPDLQAIMAAARAGERPQAPYLLDDMAQDAVALLDALGIAEAHVVGLSMGGMIGQILAARHGARVLSLTSIMSTSGRPGLPAGKPEAMQALLSRPAADDRESLIAHGMWLLRTLNGTGYPLTDDYLRAYVSRNVDRSYYPPGGARQFAAVVASGSRAELLPTVAVPALVIHGEDDPLIPLAAGQDTAALIPGCRIEVIERMGHHLPPAIVPRLVDSICGHCAG